MEDSQETKPLEDETFVGSKTAVDTLCVEDNMPDKCSKCNNPVLKSGLCGYHYRNQYFNKDKHKIHVQNWKNKHPDYFKNYYLNNKDKYKKTKEYKLKNEDNKTEIN